MPGVAFLKLCVLYVEQFCVCETVCLYAVVYMSVVHTKCVRLCVQVCVCNVCDFLLLLSLHSLLRLAEYWDKMCGKHPRLPTAVCFSFWEKGGFHIASHLKAWRLGEAGGALVFELLQILGTLGGSFPYQEPKKQGQEKAQDQERLDKREPTVRAEAPRGPRETEKGPSGGHIPGKNTSSQTLLGK